MKKFIVFALWALFGGVPIAVSQTAPNINQKNRPPIQAEVADAASDQRPIEIQIVVTQLDG